jgi:hypothetical protein
MTIRFRAGRAALAIGLALLGLAVAASAAGTGAAAQPAAESCQNVLGDSGFEAPSSPWAQASIPDRVTLWDDFWPIYRFPLPVRECRPEACEWRIPGYNDPAGPQAGDYWAWFGGGITSTLPITQVTQVITQLVTAPAATTARLEFDLWISRADAGSTDADRLEARVGEATVFSVTAALTTTYAFTYTSVAVELGGLISSPLTISATTRAAQAPAGSAAGPPIVNFNVDNVRVCIRPATPTPTATSGPSVTPPAPTFWLFLPFAGKG